MATRSMYVLAVLAALPLQAADTPPPARSQPVDTDKLPSIEQRSIIPLPSERLPTGPLPSPQAPPPASPSSKPAPDSLLMEKQQKERNWLFEGMEAKREEKKMTGLEKQGTDSTDYLDGYIREQQLLQKLPSTDSSQDTGFYRPSLGPPVWSNAKTSQPDGTSSPGFQPSLSQNPGAASEPFADSSLTLHNNGSKPIAPLLGPPQAVNNEYRPPTVPGVSDGQQGNIKLLSRDPNALPNGYEDPVERLRAGRQQTSQPIPPALTREEIERRLNETSRPRPKTTEIRRSIPDPTSLDF